MVRLTSSRMVELSYHGASRMVSAKEGPVSVFPGFEHKSCHESRVALRALGWASVAVGIAALGLYVGRELRQRYKFKRRTPVISIRTPATSRPRPNSAWASSQPDQI